MEFSSEEILNTITDERGNTLISDINDLYDLLDEVPEDEDYGRWLVDMVQNERLTEDNFEQIYNLIPDGAVYEYTAAHYEDEEEANPEFKELMYVKSPLHDIHTIRRAAIAIIAGAVGENITDETEYINNINSGYETYREYDTITPSFSINAYVESSDIVGYFEKQFPDDEHLRYDFNIDDDSLMCVFSALFKQDDEMYTLCNEEKPLPEEENDFYARVINKCNLTVQETFAISANNVHQIYRIMGKVYKINMNISYYYLKENKESISAKNLNKKTLKIVGNESDQLINLAVAKLGNHLFNINKGNHRREDALNYLQKVGQMYDQLPNRKKRTRFSELNRLSREHAKTFKQLQNDLLRNPHKLLDEKEDYIVREKIDEDVHGTDKNKVVYVPFVFDYETVLNENNEHCIYSYVVRKIDISDNTSGSGPRPTPIPVDNTSGSGPRPTQESFFTNQPFKVLNPKDVKSKRLNPLVRLFEFVIRNTKQDERAILFAHNGAKFDNLINLKLAANTFGMHSFKEVTAGPNNDIMLSLDITYSYRKGKNLKNYLKKVISFRDSYKLLDCRASDIPANYGIEDFKLPYCYQLYNDLFKPGTKLTAYQIDTFFKDKEDNRFVKRSSKGEVTLDTKTAEAYERIYNGDILNDNLSDNLKQDIIIYREALKKKKCYYLPKEYCVLYNKYDVVVVEQGLLKMQEYLRSLHSIESICSLVESTPYANTPQCQALLKTIKENNMCIPSVVDLDIFKYRSLASLVFDMAKKAGVFDNICQLKGNLKKFIQLSVVGGRVMKNPDDNKNVHIAENYDHFMSLVGKDSTPELDKEINDKAMDCMIDNDAVSLYPSAISLCYMPAGEPEIINLNDENQKIVADNIHKVLAKCRTSSTNNIVSSQERQYFCLDITTNKDLDYPILSELDENGIRRFRNGSFKKIVIGDTTLSDVIKYQDAKVTRVYTVVRFKSTCSRFSEFIKTLFMLRAIFKLIKLPCQNAIKLIMNSSYGRTILKQSIYKKSYKRYSTPEDKNNFYKFVSKNYFHIKPQLDKIGMYVRVQKRDLVDNPTGYPHIGSYILEMSKMLMNKMFDKLYSNGFHVYYTDTDSIHTTAGSLTKVGDMLGSDMTKFHSDFDAPGCRPVNPKVGIFAIKSIFVMKKCYYDKLFCVDYKTNKYTIREHKRAKGVPVSFMSEDIYEKLLKGESLECEFRDHRDMILRKNKQGGLVSLQSFKRTISRTN